MSRGFARFLRQNAIALLALFLALGGTSFAAATLISGSQIKPHTIAKNRLTNKAIKQLKGNRGPRGLQGARGPTGAQGTQGARGPTGAQGVAGTPAAKYFAHISYSGTTPSVAYGTGGISVSAVGTGGTSLTFPTNVGTCATQLTLFDTGADGSVRKGTASGGSTVTVQVKDLTNTARDWGYDVAEFC